MCLAANVSSQVRFECPGVESKCGVCQFHMKIRETARCVEKNCNSRPRKNKVDYSAPQKPAA